VVAELLVKKCEQTDTDTVITDCNTSHTHQGKVVIHSPITKAIQYTHNAFCHFPGESKSAGCLDFVLQFFQKSNL